MVSGSISENRIFVAMEPPILEWLRYEARFFGISVPAVIREKLRSQWQTLPTNWRDQLKK